MAKRRGEDRSNRYKAIIEQIFFNHYQKGSTEFEFEGPELVATARDLGVPPSNLPDVLYTFRFRSDLPTRVLETQSRGKGWVIELAGRAKYRFRLIRAGGRIVPQAGLALIKIPDATPEIVAFYARTEEQALLARLRYNRLIDTFLGITAYSLQNHLRGTVESLGQIEIDELYVGVDKRGAHYLIPVQAKRGTDFLSTVQANQDVVWCQSEFPALECRSVSAQFMSDEVIALFELTKDGDDLAIAEERHYKLVPAEEVPEEQKSNYLRSRNSARR
jgi:hypothetical protein